VSLRDTGSQVEIAVQDSGPGVKADFLPHVFERFRQDTSTGARPGGLGLGLAIVRQLVELHGGTVAAQNREDGSGALFTIHLPRTPKDHVEAVAATTQFPFSREAPPSLHDVRVLVVDDEPDAREVVGAMLAQLGADVTVSATAEEGLTLLGRIRPHVLVSDISMPVQDGYDFLRAVRALPESEGGITPAIALTTSSRIEDSLRSLQAGFQFHITKQVQPFDLAQAIVSLAKRVG
jgi:CheY-like chemotaxis protein